MKYAAISDELPPDVESGGRDRCIIDLRHENLDAWLSPETQTRAQLQLILSARAVSTFEHAASQVA